MLVHHGNNKKEMQQFTRASKMAQSGSDKLALDLIDKFNKNFKKVFINPPQFFINCFNYFLKLLFKIGA